VCGCGCISADVAESESTAWRAGEGVSWSSKELPTSGRLMKS